MKNMLLTFFVYDPVISDHFAVHCRLNLDMPHVPKQVIIYKKLRSVNADDFRRDIINSPLCQSPSTSLSGLCDQYENVLSSILDNHTPLRTKTYSAWVFSEFLGLGGRG